MKIQPPRRIVVVCDLYQARIWPPVAWSPGWACVMTKTPAIQRATVTRPTRAQLRFSDVFMP